MNDGAVDLLHRDLVRRFPRPARDGVGREQFLGDAYAGTVSHPRSMPRAADLRGSAHERVCARGLPRAPQPHRTAAVRELARFDEAVHLVEAADLAGARAQQHVRGAQVARVGEPGGGDQRGDRVDGVVVVVRDALRLVGNDEAALQSRVLCGNAGGTLVGVAAARLQAAERQHEAARGVGPVGAE